MQTRCMKVALVLLVGFVLVCGLPLWGQAANTGSMVGSVTDQSGAVVAGANVGLTDSATGQTRTVSTNTDGRYVFSNVQPGHYKLTASKAGFATATTSHEVQVGVTSTVNLAMQVGSASTTVEVRATGTELETTNATVGNTVTGIALDSLPSLNRDVSTFVELQPGVSPDGSVAGAVVDESTFQLDGGNNTNDMDGSMSVYTASFAGDPTNGVSNQSYAVAAGPTGVVPTPADSVEEFKVNTANQGNDFNSSSGAQVQVVTKRGTNTWHGSVYEYYLDNNFSANTWENNATAPKTPVPDWHRNRFGARAGGVILPKLLGGKTYLFANYEGYRWGNSTTIERTTPSAAMRLGLLTFGGTTYNLNPTPVTFNGVTYPGSTLDPLGIGISPVVQQMWNKFMPLSNEGHCGLSFCDDVNIQGFRANVAIPETSDFGVARIDHDFGDKWHFMSSYRYFKLTTATIDQVDIGGFFPGDKLGVPASQSSAPQLPWYYVAGLTTNITSNITNDFHYSMVRNWWAWGRAGDTVQFPGLGGALEPLGESHYQTLAPYNVNTQQTRTRFWDGRDHQLRDDVSWLRGNHLLQFGGLYQHNFNWHQRTDNGGGINYQPVYQLGTSSGAGSGINMKGFVPAGVPSSKTFGRDYAAVLGLVSASQQAYTRSGANLKLNSPLTPAFDQSTIPYYSLYFSDTWRVKPTISVTYGLGWALEMPPVEKAGKQVEFVDSSNKPIDVQSYLAARQKAALAGQVFNPIVGFDLVHNTHRKYPYDPYYKQFSPRFAVAWNPHFDADSMGGKAFGTDSTVIRAGYGRIYGRLNGVDLVLVPLLGTGLIQAVQCFGPLATGPAGTCGGTPATVFRIEPNSLVAPLPAAQPTLPQPLFPGINGVSAGAGEALDPHFRPNVVDSVDFTIQRQVGRNLTFEAGYIGRYIKHEYQPLNVNAVPYMMTLGGQRFDKAYANMLLQYCGGFAGLAGGGCNAPKGAFALTPQPFFEAALKPTGYCAGFANCTTAVAANEGVNGTGNLNTESVWSLWSDLDGGGIGGGPGGSTVPGFIFPRSMLNTPINTSPFGANGQLSSGVGVNASVGYGNYNGAFFSAKMNNWRGITTQSNFTWSKSLSTSAVVQATSADTAADPYNLRRGYGLAGFDRKFVFNQFVVYQPPFYKGQSGVLGHLLGGWTFAPIFTAGTGLPETLGTINGGGQAFGEADSVAFVANGNSENAIPMGPIPSPGVHYSVVDGVPTINQFANPAAVLNNIRQPILGIDNHDGGFGVLRGLPYWNVDMSVRKQFKVTEVVNIETGIVFDNIFNHAQMLDPNFDYLDTSSPGSWGVLPGQTNGTVQVLPRTMEFGLRVNF